MEDEEIKVWTGGWSRSAWETDAGQMHRRCILCRRGRLAGERAALALTCLRAASNSSTQRQAAVGGRRRRPTGGLRVGAVLR